MVSMKEIARNNSILLYAVLIYLIVQGIVLSFIMIRRTHRISGPIYLLSVYTRDIIEGRYPQMRPLRRLDEFTDYYDLFAEMVETLKERKVLQ